MSARALPPEAAIPPARIRNARGWWIVPLVVVGLVLIGWLLLAGLPFGGEERTIVKKPATVPIAEGAPISTPQQTGTILELPGDEPFETPVTTAPPMPGGMGTSGGVVTPDPAPTQTVPPPATATQAPPPTETASRPPVGTPEPVTRPRPVTPRPVTPPPSQPAPRQELSEGEAVSRLRGYLSSRKVYDVESSCLQVRNQGYRNVGYTMSVWDSCNAGGGSRMLGRWRVDAKTGEIFRQRADGRYLEP